MLENIKLTKSDNELQQLDSVKLIVKLSLLSYFSSIVSVLFWGVIFIALHCHHQEIALYIADLIRDLGKNQFGAIFFGKPKVLAFATMLIHKPFYVVIVIDVLVLMFIVPSVLHIIRSLKTTLIVDDDGVWLKKGLFSFTTEVQGVVWRNADLAGSRNNFIYYLTGSYPIRIRNRYSGILELSTPPIIAGRKAIGVINKEVSKINQNLP